jgi:hypothetical protein
LAADREGGGEERLRSGHLVSSKIEQAFKGQSRTPVSGDISLPHLDDRYNKLRRDIGNDFSSKSKEGGEITELYSFHCGNCGYQNIHNIRILSCGCGKELHGNLVYRKVGDTVIYDSREGKGKRW